MKTIHRCKVFALILGAAMSACPALATPARAQERMYLVVKYPLHPSSAPAGKKRHEMHVYPVQIREITLLISSQLRPTYADQQENSK
jgi:hypothetical protein